MKLKKYCKNDHLHNILLIKEKLLILLKIYSLDSLNVPLR